MELSKGSEDIERGWQRGREAGSMVGTSTKAVHL